ncbi:CYTH domain-containing protein [Sporolactobacillus shoreae]|uniref:CYTH domain-containing protein n=1 Tax=Sporolactobacillus shoreae TaxID=1465501 RepID=A0A4Z0GRQ9_9BACL|nr:CYTH domain-containing protein [Sporolactobacillus shoreae]TGB00104.1 CYTH domain-containing protein [Sporolactobacillus shoreae]
MPRELEIEFKNMLTKEEFNVLCRRFGLTDASFFKQVNDYFDTPTFGLKGKKSALRIRHVNGRHDFTLKQPHDGAVLETHQDLSDDESKNLIQYGIMPAGEVEQAIAYLGIDVDQLLHIGELMTKRTEIPYKNGKLFLDQSSYLDHHDYELEYEAGDPISGGAIFQSFLLESGLSPQPSKSKIVRLYEALKEKGAGA